MGSIPHSVLNLLNNKDLESYLQMELGYDGKEFRKMKSNAVGNNNQSKLKNMIESVIQKDDTFKENFNDFLYETFYQYELNNQLVYKMSFRKGKTKNDVYNAVEKYVQNIHIKYENAGYFSDISNYNDQFAIVNQKVQNDDKIEILTRLFVNNHTDILKAKSVFLGFEFNFKDKLIVFKWNENRVREYFKLQENHIKISDLVIYFIETYKKITNENLRHMKATSLNISREASSEFEKLTKSNEFESFLYNIFKLDYEEKCNSFSQDAFAELEQTVSDAVENLALHDIHDEQAKMLVRHLKFHDIAIGKEALDYRNFIFSFAFKDLNITSSKTFSKDHKPIYSSNIYWYLVKIALDMKKMNEIGMYISFKDPQTNKTYTQEILMVSKNGQLIFKYYQYDIVKEEGGLNSLMYKTKSRRIVDEHLKGILGEFISEARLPKITI